jgi:hypothetical protein
MTVRVVRAIIIALIAGLIARLVASSIGVHVCGSGHIGSSDLSAVYTCAGTLIWSELVFDAVFLVVGVLAYLVAFKTMK